MNLPKNKTTTKLLSSFLVSVFFLTISATQSLAATAYFDPVSGFINNREFLLSVFVESTTTEPEMASANINITYPVNVGVVDILDGEFDTYVQKEDNPATRTITVNATNNATNYKSGTVKIASIRFEALANNEPVDLTITSDSEITGAGGEQLLTETINAAFTINLSPEEAALLDSGSSTTTTTTTTDPTTTTTTVPETGWNQLPLYAGISLVLLVLGLANFLRPNVQSRK